MGLINYLFSSPGSEFSYYWLFIALFTIVIITAYIVRYRMLTQTDRALRKLVKPYPFYATWTALFGFAYLGFRSMNTSVLSSRILLVIILLFLVYFVVKPFVLVNTKYVDHIKHQQRRQEQKKWVPTRKKKRSKKRK